MTLTATNRPRAAQALLLLGLWLLFSLLPLAGAQAEGRPYGQGRFWKIERDGVEPSYLLGTMHASLPRVVAVPPSVTQALDGSQRVVLEVVFDGQTEMALARSMVLTDGRGLSDMVGPEVFTRVTEVGARYGLPGQQINVLKPWAVTALFSLPADELARQASGALPLDRVLQDRAAGRGLPVLGLETVDEQLSVFTGMSEADQVALLESALALNGQVEEIFARMTESYLAGDLDGLHAMAEEQAAGADPRLAALFQERLIEARNYRMAERLDPHLAKGGVFAAVGALHLSGEEGVLNLLVKQGYKVQPAN